MLNKLVLKFIILANLLILLICIGTASYPAVTGDIEVLYPRSSDSLTAQKLLQSKFKDSFFDVITVKNQDLEKYYFELDDFQSKLADLQGVDSILSPLTTNSQGMSFGFLLRPPEADLSRFIIAVNKELSDQQRLVLNKAINRLIAESPELSLNRHGSFFVTESLTEAVSAEVIRLVPVCICLLLVLLCFLLKSLKRALITLLPASLALFTTLGVSALCNIPLNPISQLAPSFILVVGLAYSIHIYVAIMSQGYLPKSILSATLFASLTTSAGLFSLINLNVTGVSLFAVTAGCGNILAAGYASILLPRLLASKGNQINSFNLVEFLVVHQKKALCILVLLSLSLISGLLQIRIDTNPLSFLPKQGNAYQQAQKVEREFPGNRFISLLISKDDHASLSKNEILELNKLTEFFKNDPEIVSLVDPVDAIKNEQKVQEYSINESSHSTELLISKDRRNVRYLLESSYFGKALLDQVSKLEKKVAEFLSGYNYAFTGFEIIMAEQSQHIIRGIISSLLCTLAILALILLLISRSFLITLIALIPNLIPIIVVYGLVGYVYGEISLGAAIVSCAVLGIAVDNTFHLLMKWRESKNIKQVIDELAPAFSLTMLTLAIGFSGMLFAEVLPTFQFSLLLIATLVVGLIADVTILPYFLSRLQQKN